MTSIKIGVLKKQLGIKKAFLMLGLAVALFGGLAEAAAADDVENQGGGHRTVVSFSFRSGRVGPSIDCMDVVVIIIIFGSKMLGSYRTSLVFLDVQRPKSNLIVLVLGRCRTSSR
jgi:hypothetical protein